jgi:flagellin-like hook-associated protein FlgL
MRITNFMLVNDLRRNLNNNLERMDEYQRQLSTGRTINKPSDNPAGIVKSLRLRTTLVEGAQYMDNIGEAVNFMQTTDSACNDINEVLQKIRELTVKAATGTNDTDSNQAIAKQVAELNNQLMMIANSTYGSKYIFSGTNVTEAPYQDGVWVGNNDYLNMEVGAGIKVPVNLMMQEFFMGRLRDTYINPKASFINKVEAENLREGDYQLKTSTGLACAAGINLKSPNNEGMFFFTNDVPPQAVAINAGNDPTALAADSIYSGGLTITVTAVNEVTDELTVNVSGKLAIGGGQFQEVQFNGLTMNMAAPDGEAILTIPSDPAANPPTGIAATIPGAQPLIIWNNSGSTLGGIDDTSPQFAMGDKLNISLNSSQAVAREQQSYLSSTANNGSFFYQSKDTPATLGVGKDVTALDNDSSYNGSLLLEVKRIIPASGNISPRFTLNGSNDANGGVFTLNKPLYQKDNSGVLQPVSDGQDLASSFTYTGTGSLNTAIYNYDETTGIATITFTTTPGTLEEPGATIMWNNDWDAGEGKTVPESGHNKVYDQYGNEYTPIAANCDGVTWDYEDNYSPAKAIVDIKGHLYTSSGKYKYVELENVLLDDMETARNQEIFRISASEIGDPDFTEDLVIWNAGTDTLGGISLVTPEIAVGDKTVISLSAQGTGNAQSVDIGYTYKDIKGEQTGAGNHNFVFAANTLDNKLNEFKIFTLDEETGLSYDGSVTLETGAFQASADGAVRFDYEAGLFGYVADLTRRIEVGKLPQVGNELAGNDTRMKELLFYRSTIGARINRLELQQSRLEYTQESFTSLLSKNEDANEAEVILNLKLQENVYRSSLAAGARIIMPTLIDFLR